MARTPRGQEQHPPRESRNEELGQGDEERDRHLRYAHEQYTASGQGRFGMPDGRPLPSEKPARNRRKYPKGTALPWPEDRTIEAEPSPEPPPKRPVGS